MQNSSRYFIDVRNEMGTSGQFLALARNGRLMDVSAMVQERVSVEKMLAEVEKQLLACNHPVTLSKLAEWCTNEEEFASSLPKLAAGFEAQKKDLLVKLHRIDQELVKEELGAWETIPAPMASLIPRSVTQSNPFVVERNKIIDANPHRTHLDICRLIDKYCKDNGKEVRDYLPERWEDDCGVSNFVAAYHDPKCKNRVQKMISLQRSASP